MTLPNFLASDAGRSAAPKALQLKDSIDSDVRALVHATGLPYKDICLLAGINRNTIGEIFDDCLDGQLAARKPLFHYFGFEKLLDGLSVPLSNFDTLGLQNRVVLLELEEDSYVVPVIRNQLYDIHPIDEAAEPTIAAVYVGGSVPSRVEIQYRISVHDASGEMIDQYPEEEDTVPRSCTDILSYAFAKHSLQNVWTLDPEGAYSIAINKEFCFSNHRERLSLATEVVKVSPSYLQHMYPEEYTEPAKTASSSENGLIAKNLEIAEQLFETVDFIDFELDDEGNYQLNGRVIYDPVTTRVMARLPGRVRYIGRGFKCLLTSVVVPKRRY